MPHRASVTVSPSSSRISRSTPWVDGCCGPMLTTTRSSATSSLSPWVMESQSCPVTVKTRPSLVSAGPAYMSWSGHEYDLRSSGGGMVPPLYSTGMPPSG